MKTIPIAGTASSVSFFEDDTLEIVRQHIALAVNSHPDRLIIEAHLTLPANYYADPRHWEALFGRVSYNDVTVDKELFRTYVEQVRMHAPIEPPKSKEDWMAKPAALEPLFAPAATFLEWRFFGVADERCVALPMPPKDLPLPTTRVPVVNGQSLYETRYLDHDITEFRVTPMGEPTQLVLRTYFPLFQPDTPNRLSDSEIQSLRSTHEQIERLMALNAPKPPHVSVLRAKWFVPLVSTSFAAPRAQFEEMFFGLTVSKKVPYVGYFTSKQEQTRHKFYVTDPDTKTPHLDVGMWKAWIASTLPQRRLPTLMVYRGTSKTSFDRIAITPKDITFTFWRGKEANEPIETTRASLIAWFKSLDAVIPFIDTEDIGLPRWDLQDLTVLASFGKDIKSFDMRRFPCLRPIFSAQDDSFRLMRAEHLVDNLSPQELRAYQVLYETDSTSPQTLVDELGMDPTDAQRMVQAFANLGEEFDLERVLRGYPTMKFSSKEVIVSSVTNIERTIEYASLLRYVMTSEDAALDDVCPRRMETVEAVAAPVAPSNVQEGNFEIDDEFAAMLGLDQPVEEPEATGMQEGWVRTRGSRVKLESGEGSTYKYFARRLREFNNEMFDENYPSACEKTKQVVVLTPEKERELTEKFPNINPRSWTALELKNPDGIAICPQYWCILDEIPLTAQQVHDAGDACPECGGKVIVTKTDRTPEFTVIKRNQDNVFPAYKDKAPCCYKEKRSSEVLAKDEKSDATYILSSATLPALRLGYLSDEIARSIHTRTDYTKSVPRMRIEAGNKDFFRVGLGRASLTLPELLNDTTPIPEPEKAEDVVTRCSFFRTWTDLGEGETQKERILAGIQTAYKTGKMTMLDELEYVTAILKCKVIRLNGSSVSCGYWQDIVKADSRTIVLVDLDVLAHVRRREKKSGKKFDFTADIQKEPFAKDTVSLLNKLHAQACAMNIPDLQAALTEVRVRGKTSPQLILDPFGRIQAILVPNEVVLPIQPTPLPPAVSLPSRSGYADIRPDELPTREKLRAFLDASRHPGFKWVEDLADVKGRPTESLLASGFRAPFKPADAVEGQPAQEVVGTIMKTSEQQLIDGKMNSEDASKFTEISYAAEVFDFLLFSLSKDVQLTEYTPLRNSITKRDANLYKRLETWMTKKSYWEHVDTPKQFINKVRTPCGQFKQKDACNSSSLCGWNGNTCRIRVNESVEKKPAVLRRMVKTLMENDKQRALVLDERMSPFFSTVLYLEMPHEWITTSV